jgi:hypothetical protein
MIVIYNFERFIAIFIKDRVVKSNKNSKEAEKWQKTKRKSAMMRTAQSV